MHFNHNILILTALVIGFLFLMTYRKLCTVSKKTIKPVSARVSNKTSRIAETLILFCAGFLIIIFTATNTSTGGSLLILDKLNPVFAKINVVITLCALAGLLIALLVTLLGRTSVGLLIGVMICISYGILLNNYHEAISKLTPGGAATPPIPYTISISNSQIEGVELWVNGVLLGETPVQTTVEEFLKKVPYWPEPPKDFRGGPNDVRVPRYSPRGGSSYSTYLKWWEFELPNIPQQYSDLRKLVEGKNYYARVKLNGHWGYFTGHGRGGGSGGGYTYTAESHFSASFPNLQENIDKMLDYARFNDYHVGADWFAKMETFGQVGLNAIYNAINDEPDMNKVLDEWASWKYGLDKVTDEKSAWEVFEKICDEADRLQSYATSSIAGRAVELLTGKIDPDQLVNKAIEIIRNTGTFGWNSWITNGRFQFGMTYNSDGMSVGVINGTWSGGGGERFPVSGYAVAHAIWILDKSLDTQDDSQPNIVEKKVVPNVIAWHYNQEQSLLAAAALDGPVIENFLLRHNWRNYQIDPENPLKSVYGNNVNGALYLLANMDNSFGKKFRRDNKDLLMSFAEQFDVTGIEANRLSGQNPFAFLFIDKELALGYWPKFKARTFRKSNEYDALKDQFYYLVNMEPLSTVEMYISSWKGFTQDYTSFSEALSVLDKLSSEKHDLVIEAIEQSIKEDVSHIRGLSESDIRNYLLREIKSNHWSKIRTARDILKGLESNTGEYKPQAVSDWLEHDEPDHPLIKMLADANEPQLRLIVMGALRENPTPANRAVLKKLLNDSDEQVRSAAKQVALELEQLKETSPAKFATHAKFIQEDSQN